MTIADHTRPAAETAATAPMAALVVGVSVVIGQHVGRGEVLCTTETMKCETSIFAEVSGWITSVPAVGATVNAGDLLVTIAPAPPHLNDAERGGRVPRTPVSRGSRPTTAPRSPWQPSSVITMLCDDANDLLPETATGRFVEHTLAGSRLVPVDDASEREAGVMVGIISHVLNGHPDGLERVLICGDPSRSMGAVAEAECRLIIAALDLAADRGLPVEWIAVSAGARIAWDSGTENMDWCAAVARRIVHFSQGSSSQGAGSRAGAINIIVAGVNVGAQSYWNALATMLGHTAGVLIMIEGTAMVLTGRRALALSGGGHHDSETDIGGYAEVMGANGEAHHVAPNLDAAYRLLFDHLALCERRADGSPSRAETDDVAGRSICDAPSGMPGPLTTVGDVLEARHNPGRKRSFAIRPVMAALADSDAERLERWADQAASHPAVVWDTRLDGRPVCLIGIESQPAHDTSVPGTRLRASGTLYPQASRKIARALNAASGRRPAVVLANLAGFDGSAESMIGRQLEFGAEIARAVVNFDGPVVVVVIGRFHGGAYVVFSRQLNPSVSVLALGGTYVSVIGGDAAAGVVFAREVSDAVAADLASAGNLRTEADLVVAHRDAVARRFDSLHSVERAERVGSVDAIIEPSVLRQAIIDRLNC